jgi:nucleoside-diphosphate-sugar epimerase
LLNYDLNLTVYDIVSNHLLNDLVNRKKSVNLRNLIKENDYDIISNYIDCVAHVIKMAIENFLSVIASNTETSFIILRPSNPYGKNYFYSDRILGIIIVVLLKLKNNEPIYIWGDGKNQRDYIYIKDLTSSP